MSLNKVKNIRFVNAKLVSSGGTIKFDVNGVAEIESEEFYNELLEIPGFEPFEGAMESVELETEDAQPETDNIQEEVEEPEDKDEEAEAEDEDDGLTEEKLQEKSIKQLLYLAKLKKIEVSPNLKKAEIIQTILNN